MSERHVWVSNPNKMENVKRWNEFEREDRSNAAVSDELYEMWERNERGEPLDPSEVPDRFYKPRSEKPAMPPDTAHIMNSGFLFVSPECATVLRAHEMGEGQLIPVRLFESDRTTELPEGWCVLNVAARKDTYLPEASARTDRPYGDVIEAYTLPANPKDDEQAFGPGALEGADIWREKRFPLGHLFLTDRLADALREAGVAEPWLMTRCRVEETVASPRHALLREPA